MPTSTFATISPGLPSYGTSCVWTTKGDHTPVEPSRDCRKGTSRHLPLSYQPLCPSIWWSLMNPWFEFLERHGVEVFKHSDWSSRCDMGLDVRSGLDLGRLEGHVLYVMCTSRVRLYWRDGGHPRHGWLSCWPLKTKHSGKLSLHMQSWFRTWRVKLWGRIIS